MTCRHPVAPEADCETKARYLRWLYRRHEPRLIRHTPGKLSIDQAEQADQWQIVRTEYERLFPGERDELELAQILHTVWKEARHLAGWTYDRTAQCWHRADGSVVIDDDGSEWRHL